MLGIALPGSGIPSICSNSSSSNFDGAVVGMKFYSLPCYFLLSDAMNYYSSC